MLKWIRGFFILSLLLVILGSLKMITDNPFASKKSNELNIFVYSDFLDLEMIDRFTEETGIKVNLHFFFSNQELLTKFRISDGEGYDLLICTDYASQILNENGHLQKMDKTRLNFIDRIYPFLLGKVFDPANYYSLPYAWEAYGIAYNPDGIDKQSLSLNDLFTGSHKKVMTSDPIEMITIASSCLFGDKESLTKEDEAKITKLLRHQKDSIEAYADFRAKDIVSSNNAPVALLRSSYIDGMKNENSDIEFTLPSDRIFLCIENAVVCQKSQNLDNAYTFLNYIYKPENLASSVEQFPCYPSCPDAFEFTPDHTDAYLDAIDEVGERVADHRFFHYISDKDVIRKIFIEAKT